MGVRIPDYTKAGKRVLSTECSLCQTCLNSCPERALKLAVGLDAGVKELLRKRELEILRQAQSLP